jgi:lysophospholipase L1-like esterase
MVGVLSLGVMLALALPLRAGADPGHAKYVLVLGDSIAAGTQPLHPIPLEAGGVGQPEDYINRSGEGYGDQLVAQLNAEGAKLKLVNLACYYETTEQMISGGGLCSYPHGSQLDEAVQFLHAHGDHVQAVVISIGANDMNFGCPANDLACYMQQLAVAGDNLGTILSQLRAEDEDVKIGVTNYWNVNLIWWFASPALAELANTIMWAPVAATLASASAPYGATIVDTQAAFHTYDFTPGPDGIPINVALYCADTWMCSWNDVHPNANGYALIADTVRAALGL